MNCNARKSFCFIIDTFIDDQIDFEFLYEFYNIMFQSLRTKFMDIRYIKLFSGFG